ncbi:MAG: hypothetical protein ACOCZ8_06925 [Bacteroidota bacterium]
MKLRLTLALLLALLSFTACEEDEPTVDLDNYRQLLVGDGQRSWVPQAIYYQELDSTDVDTLPIVPGDTSASVSLLNPVVHQFTNDNLLYTSLPDGTTLDTLSFTLEQPGVITLTFDSLPPDPYHQIIRIDDNEMLVDATQSSVTASYYSVFEILYRRQ